MPLCVAIDPGVRTAAFAVFQDGVLTISAFLVSDCRRNLGNLLLAEVAAAGRPAKAMIERPTTYDTRHQKGDQEDISQLNITVGYLAATLEAADHALDIEFVEPRTWKGNIPKEVSKLRVERTLSEAEWGAIRWPSAKGLRHNVTDAIHLGLWAFARQRL